MDANLTHGSLLHKRYRIVEILGQGGMGSVYRAVDDNLGVDVAVKENLFTSDEYARQFRLEAVILANLRHPNLPRVTDHFVIEGQGQYLIMDYIDGEDLRQRMDRIGAISEEEAILIGAAMCEALEYLHTRKPSIIHRDLKPGNVRITPDGHIFLVDFGLAKLVKGSQATTTGARAMTPGYSPPEQYGTARTDPRTDIYSLGATLYASLTAVIPEDGLARAMDNVELTPLRKRNPKVSRKLAAAIEKAMAVRPDDRFQTAEEFEQALLTSNVKTQRLEGKLVLPTPPQEPGFGENGRLASEIRQDSGNGEKSPPPPALPGKAGQPRWWVVFSLFLLAILAVLAAVFIFWSPITRAFQARLAPLAPTSTSTPVPGLPTQTVHPLSTSTTQGRTVSPQPSLTATRTPLPQNTAGTPQSSITVTRTPLPTYMPSNTPVPTETYGPTPTAFGGGYGQIAFASDRSGAPQIFLMNADGSDPQPVTNMSYGACQPAWSPDGKRLVVISPCSKSLNQYPGAKMYIINADGSGMPVELQTGASGDFDPAWSPDGKRIAFTSLRDGSAQIYVLNLDNNSVIGMTDASSDVTLPDWSAQPAWSPDGTRIAYTGHSRITNTPQLWMMTSAGQDKKLLLPRGSELWNFLPDWSPDWKTILFSETSGDQELGWLMLFDYINRNPDVSHLRMQSYGTHGDYSPDGVWIAYESKDIQDANRLDYDLYRIQADGTGAILRLTDAASMEFDPAWRPIGSP